MQYLSKRTEHTRCVSLTRFSRDCCERPQLVVAGIRKRELVLVLIGPSTLPSKRPVNCTEAHRVFQNREATSPSLHIEEVVQWTINFRGWVLWREAAKCLSGYVMCEVILPYRSLDHPVMHGSGVQKSTELLAIGGRFHQECVVRSNSDS